LTPLGQASAFALEESKFEVRASENEAAGVKQLLLQMQACVRDKNYESMWQLFTKSFQVKTFGGIERLKKTIDSEIMVQLGFLELKAEPLTQHDGVLRLNAEHDSRTWTIDFVEENGLWKINSMEVDFGDWEKRLLPKLEKHKTEHFDIYYYKDSTAEKKIDKIAEQKEKGFEEICRFVGADPNVRICIVLFEDGETKLQETGHRGAGWAFDHTIVEIYNEEQKMDPYHETVHIVMGVFGNPPALFDEGFAVYMKERLGGKFSCCTRAGKSKNSGEWIELEELITYVEIGPAKSNPRLAYPEAACFVRFLIETYSRGKFLDAFRKLKASDDKTVQQENIEMLEQIYGKSLSELKKEWERAFLK
jgi:hypothetical protein